ncbi:hypothetical protein [Peribacillus alkalitolerans]|uniref:hypothetical protein n=1 Tax=Peribacillus alkalitolerans TaxID=1550385 RepID=UPI0013D61ADD|nr:hypothetical protein [Peribacillus alkalitolerans]
MSEPKDQDQSSDGLMEIFEIINAKGDEGELKEIINRYDNKTADKQENYDHNHNHDFFYQELRVISEDATKE